MSGVRNFVSAIVGVCAAVALWAPPAGAQTTSRGSGSDVSMSAAGQGVVIPSARIPARERAVLLEEIARARTEQPEAFAALAKLREQLPGLDAQKRGRLPPLTPALKATARMSLYPLLEELAVTAQPRGELTDEAWIAWRSSLLEAVGSMRDERAAPVLHAALDAPPTDFLVMKSAAEAVGKLGTDLAAAKLVGLARADGPKRGAVIAGMGHCRRVRIVETLDAVLRGKNDFQTTRHALESLANVGSSWAWETPTLAEHPEREAVRAAAARAAVRAFTAVTDPHLRDNAIEAVLVVDHPSTPQLIAEAKKRAETDGERAELDRLAQRFEQSPFRRAR